MISPISLMAVLYSCGILISGLFKVDIMFLSAILVFNVIASSILLPKKPVYLALFSFFLLGIMFSSLMPSAGQFGQASLVPQVMLAPFLKLKDIFISVIKRTCDEPYSSLLGSIIFGSQASPIPYQIKENYRTAGVIHLLVASGTQVSIVLSSVSGILKMIAPNRIVLFVLCTIANFSFTLMTGAGPSMMRASFMGEAALISRMLGRNNDPYNSLALSAFIILLISPSSLFDIGFQLSFLSTWALFYVGPVLKEKLKFAGNFAGILSASAAPYICTLPVIAFNFNQLSLVSIISNILVLPWIESVVVLGFVSVIFGAVFLPIAQVINNGLSVALIILNFIIDSFAAFPLATVNVATINLLTGTIYYILLIVMIEKIKNNIRINVDLKKLSFALLVAIIFFQFTAFASNELNVTFFDVGQGDSILVEAPSGQKMLIDGGSRKFKTKDGPYGQTVLSLLKKKGINNIDILVLTHPHEDHLGGLISVVEKIKIGRALDIGYPHPSPLYLKYLKLIDKKNIPYVIARKGMSIDLGGGVKAIILHPREHLLKGTKSDLNENSIVINLTYGATSFLLVGDIGFAAEKALMSSGEDLRADVLKIAHHGSSYGTSSAFIEKVKPKYAVIMVGLDNKFGHPSSGPITRLQNAGVNILRTDNDGTIIIKSDGKSLSIVK